MKWLEINKGCAGSLPPPVSHITWCNGHKNLHTYCPAAMSHDAMITSWNSHWPWQAVNVHYMMWPMKYYKMHNNWDSDTQHMIRSNQEWSECDQDMIRFLEKSILHFSSTTNSGTDPLLITLCWEFVVVCGLQLHCRWWHQYSDFCHSSCTPWHAWDDQRGGEILGAWNIWFLLIVIIIEWLVWEFMVYEKFILFSINLIASSWSFLIVPDHFWLLLICKSLSQLLHIL